MIGEPDGRWRGILRAAGGALKSSAVGVFETDRAGHVRPLLANFEGSDADEVTAELEVALREWQPDHWEGRRWIASKQAEGGRWCIAPVRSEPAPPPPTGVERRGASRLTLELAGVAIGLLDQDGSTEPPITRRHETRESRQDLEDFFENATVAMHWIGPDGRIMKANKAELSLLGYSREEYVGRHVTDVHVDPVRAKELLRRLMAGETIRNAEVRLRHRDGTVRHVLLSANARFERGKYVHSRSIVRDITERRLVDEALARYQAMVESAEDAIIGGSLDGVITSWNQAAEKMHGWTAAEAIGQPISILIPEDRPEEVAEVLRRIRNGEKMEHYESVHRRKDGSLIDVSIMVSPIMDSEGHPIGASAIARDITERRKFQEQLLHSAMHDTLTDLPNRAYFIERLAQSMDRAHKDVGYKFAVLFLDCDNFKIVNDSLGHSVGDKLLAGIAGRLRNCVRPGDVVARLGGDEFTVLLEDVLGPPDVDKSTVRIQRCLAPPFQLEGREVFATMSIGVAIGTQGATKPEDLLRDADIAMYKAKTGGKARSHVFTTEMRERAQDRFGLENDLRNAIDHGELKLRFQPIVELDSGRIHAFEALVRWEHPTRGEIAPLDFIPLAEETGLILPIGRWVLHEACWNAQRWQRQYPGHGPVGIAVNVSAKQLEQGRIVNDVRQALSEVALDPKLLHLEITESAIMSNVEATADLLADLRKLKVQIHVDDFGTGYSSLSYLPLFPLQFIKIDRSFVQRMGARRTDLEVVRTIVDLATNLKMGVIAEGVETEAQREKLMGFGCNLGQGHYFSEPLDQAGAGLLLEKGGVGPVRREEKTA